ncbi:Hydrocephalus-inducing protein [Bienertia sinuspersici]
MAAALLRGSRSIQNVNEHHHLIILRYSSIAKQSHHNDHSQNQVYLKPSTIIGSWEAPKSPKEALTKLALLRRDYAKQVKELRKHYINEMELQRQEKLRKDEALKLQILRQREERNKAKAAAAQARALQRKAFEDEFRQTLMKEKTEKLEYWRKREQAIQDRKNSKKELIERQSSLWIDEEKLEEQIMRTEDDNVDL